MQLETYRSYRSFCNKMTVWSHLSKKICSYSTRTSCSLSFLADFRGFFCILKQLYVLGKCETSKF